MKSGEEATVTLARKLITRDSIRKVGTGIQKKKDCIW
jgi:hypothetical protein